MGELTPPPIATRRANSTLGVIWKDCYSFLIKICRMIQIGLIATVLRDRISHERARACDSWSFGLDGQGDWVVGSFCLSSRSGRRKWFRTRERKDNPQSGYGIATPQWTELPSFLVRELYQPWKKNPSAF